MVRVKVVVYYPGNSQAYSQCFVAATIVLHRVQPHWSGIAIGGRIPFPMARPKKVLYRQFIDLLARSHAARTDC
jgi:hypothetical protein